MQAAPAAAADDGASLPVERYTRLLPASERDIAAFYRAYEGITLWVDQGQLRPEARMVVDLVNNAAADGLNPADYRPRELEQAVQLGYAGSPADLARAELLLSRAVSAYVRDLRSATGAGMTYVDQELQPATPTRRAVLEMLANAPSLGAAIQESTQLNPLYNQLRETFAAQLASGSLSDAEAGRVRASLARLRALPDDLGSRFVLVDAASAKLWMYENGRPVDSMKVVIGRPGEQTPLMAAYIRHLTLNPYWNVPPDLVQRLIAPNVLDQGAGYLRTAGYEVLSDWSGDARTRDAQEVDWKAVAAGSVQLPLRQLPGPRNSMGSMKFMFPNQHGVYLHDTPNRELFSESDRRRSAGCVRLQDAPRLARWLFGKTVRPTSKAPEQNVPLDGKVPVYITYLTAMPERGRIVYHDDHYNRDRQLIAQLGGRGHSSAR